MYVMIEHEMHVQTEIGRIPELELLKKNLVHNLTYRNRRTGELKIHTTRNNPERRIKVKFREPIKLTFF